MLCIMPKLGLTEDYVQNVDSVNNQSAVSTVVSNTTGSVARLFIGFVLDNLPTYKNISESNPDIRINLIQLQLGFDRVEPFVSFNPSSNTHLTITVCIYVALRYAYMHIYICI
jgi:hypothetical protein